MPTLTGSNLVNVGNRTRVIHNSRARTHIFGNPKQLGRHPFRGVLYHLLRKIFCTPFTYSRRGIRGGGLKFFRRRGYEANWRPLKGWSPNCLGLPFNFTEDFFYGAGGGSGCLNFFVEFPTILVAYFSRLNYCSFPSGAKVRTSCVYAQKMCTRTAVMDFCIFWT